MKNKFLISQIGLGLLAAPTLFATEKTVLVCRSESGALEGVSYEVRVEESNYFVLKLQGEKVLSRVSFGPNNFSQMINGYGGTHLYVLNGGRSGYLVIYSHKSANDENEKTTTLLDINFFQPGKRGLNTGGPKTDFECEVVNEITIQAKPVSPYIP